MQEGAWEMNEDEPPIDTGETRYTFRHAAGDDTDEEIAEIDRHVRSQENRAPTAAETVETGEEDVNMDCSFETALGRVGAVRVQSTGDGNRKRKRRNRCWGCHCGLMAGESITTGEAMRGLVSLIRENHGKMSDGELSLLVSEYHEQEIMRPAVQAGLHCDPWAPAQVLRHLRHHTLDPRIVLGENIRTLRCIIRETRKKVIRTNDDTSEETVDTKTCDTLLKTMRMLGDMYSKRPAELLFGDKEETSGDSIVSQRRAISGIH
jgi:hypothetical protein